MSSSRVFEMKVGESTVIELGGGDFLRIQRKDGEIFIDTNRSIWDMRDDANGITIRLSSDRYEDHIPPLAPLATGEKVTEVGL